MPRWIRFIFWTDESTRHVARHGISQEEVEDVAYGDSFVRRIGRGFYRVTGQTQDGRYLTVFLSAMDRGIYGEYYVVTARDATGAERRRTRG